MIEGSPYKYSRAVALPLLCVPACVNMVLVRHGYETISQTEIAEYLGLVVPPRLADTYPFAQVSEQETDWGVPPKTVERRLSELLNKHCSGKLFHLFAGWRMVPAHGHLEFIAEHLARDNDVFVGFQASAVYQEAKAVGHVAVVTAVDVRARTVKLIDPEVGDDEGIVVSWEQLLFGIKAVNDGYWLFGASPEALRVDIAV